MDEKTIEIAFGIIAHAGDAKSIAKQSIEEAKQEKYKEAKELMKKAEETLTKAHRFQTELIQEEARGNKTEVNVILVHSQDHLMTTMSYIQLANEMIDIYEFISKKIG